MRKQHDKDFRAKPALEAVKADKTLQKVVITCSIHPNMIALSEEQILEDLSALYEFAPPQLVFKTGC